MLSRFTIVITLLFAGGCQSIGALGSVVGSSVACSKAKSDIHFPGEGSSRQFFLEFSLRNDGEAVDFSDTVKCKYQGSFCGGGKWFHTWHEEEAEGFVWELEGGGKVTHHYHSWCALTERYLRECEDGECRKGDFFSFVLHVPGLPFPRLVKVDDLPDWGFELEYYRFSYEDL